MPDKRTATAAIPYTEMEVAGPYDSANGLGNYDLSRTNIDRIVIHTMAGPAEAAAARFNNLQSNVSAHYGVRLDGSLIHWLEEYNTAYHAGNYAMNQRSIGIEHEDATTVQNPQGYNQARPDALYATSAKLVADICHYYSIPCDRGHILRHNEVSDRPTACPDALDIDRIVRGAQAILSTMTPQNGLSPEQAVIDQLRTERDNNWTLYQQQVETTKQKDDRIQELGSALQQNSDEHTNALTALQTENTHLTTQLKQVNESNASIAGLYQAKCKEDSAAIDNAMNLLNAHKSLMQNWLSVTQALKIKNPTLNNVLEAIDRLLSNQKPSPSPISHVQTQVRTQMQNSLSTAQQILSLFGIRGGEKA